jgi:coenzyme PQQ biosynthesis protein PqqD
MNTDSIPKFAPGCRLHPNEPLLLVPEGTLELNDSSRDILVLVDGQRAVRSIIDKLLDEYGEADRDLIQGDVLGLLNRMQQRGVLREVVLG